MNSIHLSIQAMSPNRLGYVLLLAFLLASGASAQVSSPPSASPPATCSDGVSFNFCHEGTVVVCGCTTLCSKCGAAGEPSALTAIGEGAPEGYYQCCYAGMSCDPSQTSMTSASACSNEGKEAFPCSVNAGGTGSSCSNGSGSCSAGTCKLKSQTPEINILPGGGFSSPNMGTYCDAPKPSEFPESCDNQIDDDCNGQTDEGCDFAEPDGGVPLACVGAECQCDPRYQGDPVNITQGSSFERVVDVTLPGTLSSLEFARSYSSNPSEWLHDAPLVGVPKPFGSSPSTPDSVEWWHNHLSLVVMSGGKWSVRDRDGRLLRFKSCVGTPCWAAPGSGSPSMRERLQRTASGFVLVTTQGEKLVFEAPFATGSQGVDRYFLSRIDSSSGVTLARLTYGPPGDVSCPVGGTGTGSGVPYLAEVESPEARLLFAYRALERADGQVECVLGSVSLSSSGAADGGSTMPLVSYTYALDGTVERPGRLASVTWQDHSEQYDYPAEQFLVSSSSGRVTRHEYGTSGAVALAQGRGTALQFDSTVTVGTCQTGSNCCGRLPTARTATDLYAGRGDGTDGGSGLTRKFETLSNFGQELEPRLYQITDTCSGNAGCSPGTTRHEWTCSTANMPGYEQARKDKRDAWEVYGYAQSSYDGGTAAPQLERISVKRGATDKTGTGALEEETFSYTYSTQGEQLLSAREEESVLNPSGARARTAYRYAPGTNRTTATIQSGWTRVRGTDGTWTTARRFVGTFSFLARVATGETTEDPLGRVLEVHGPCFVSDESATDCASADHPLTQYHYWPDTEASPRRNRLKSVSTYASPSATPNVVTYNAYDSWGNPTEVIDANGVTTSLMYQEQRLSTSAVGSQAPTRYAYDQGHLTSVQYPAGNFEVFCYRKNTPSDACVGGTLTEKLQWKARASVADGALWTEKVLYTYWPDETLREERYLSWGSNGAETRRVVKHAADPHRRPTWQQVGSGAGSYATVRRFDGADNLTGFTQPFNGVGAPAFCSYTGGGTAAACNMLSYDRANRLTQESLSYFGSDERSCFSYDKQGNVATVQTGCSSSTGMNCASCTQPMARYTHDDFARIVEVSLPHSEGPTRYAYDALGNITVKETEAMRRTGEYMAFAHDALGRQLWASRVYSQPSAGQQTLYRFGYDVDEAPDASCPQTANTRGRLRYRADSFGRTWYQYDESGRVVGELRVRAGTTVCTGGTENNPHTLYAYTSNGNLATVTYPHGRVITYGYGTGAAADRLSTIDITLFDGTAWRTERILSKAAWEPYGSLRGYQLHHLTSGTFSAVEYALGDNGTLTPSTPCAAQGPSSATSDLTGRLRSLRVSSGAFTPGTYPGDIYQRTYAWQADQILATRTCVLGATSARQEDHEYDSRLRLKRYTRPALYEAWNYSYDKRGNRISLNDNGTVLTHAYGAAPFVDRLVSTTSNTQSSLMDAFVYDADGRVTEKRMNKLSSEASVRSWLAFAYGPDDAVATDTVFKAVTVGGVAYNYFYDALGRRRAKVYPTGARDEFFYDTGHQLLSDQGVSTPDVPVGYYVEDDYVWLDGRPVALVRGRFSTSWNRESDSSTDCARNSEAAACGVYFPITDHIGKTVLMLNAARKAAGIAEYDAFGHVNRAIYQAGTAHPYGNNLTNQQVTYFQQPASSGTQVRMRVLFGLVDTESSGGTPSDYVRLVDGATGAFLTDPIGGQRGGQVWTPWVQTADGRVFVRFTSNAANCCPTGNGGLDCNPTTCTQYPSYPYYGVSMAAYEYKRYQTGAQPFWTPLRFPGQYHDAETDLFENWNRYYDPSIGRYLQSEPLLQKPAAIALRALMGRTMSAYEYAGNNPINNYDPTGLDIAGDKASCSADTLKIIDKLRKKLQSGNIKNKKCKKLFNDVGMLDLASSDTVYTIFCNKPKKQPDCPGAAEGVDICGGADPENQCAKIDEKKRSGCPDLPGLVAHEVAHLCGPWPLGTGHGEADFDAITKCGVEVANEN